MPTAFFWMPQWVNILLSFSEPSSRVHKVLKSNGKIFCVLFTDLVLLYFVEQMKTDSYFLINGPRYSRRRKRNLGGGKPNPKCSCLNIISAFPHLGIGPVNILGPEHTKSWQLWAVPQIIAVLQNQGLKWNSGKAHALSVLSEILYSLFAQLLLHTAPFGEFIIGVALKWA